jgi:hypothetical protein
MHDDTHENNLTLTEKHTFIIQQSFTNVVIQQTASNRFKPVLFTIILPSFFTRGDDPAISRLPSLDMMFPLEYELTKKQETQ